MSILSKKSPNDAVNKFKLNFANKLLSQANDFLHKGYKPFDDFQQFDVDQSSTNSDVVFNLSQYIQCFEKYKSDYVVNNLVGGIGELRQMKAKRVMKVGLFI